MQKKQTRRNLIVIIEILASLIALFSFVTGWETIKEIFTENNTDINPQSFDMPELISTATVEPPQIVVGTWTQIGLKGEAISDLDISSNNTFVVGTVISESGIFKSENLGASWTQINNGISNLEIIDVEIVNQDLQHILAATFDGLWITNNGGDYWSPSKHEDKYFDTTLGVTTFESDNDTLMAIQSYGFFVSHDKGTSWNEGKYNQLNGEGDIFNALSTFTAIGTGNNPTKTIYIAGDREILRTQDNGESWLRVSDVGKSYPVTKILVDPNIAKVVYVCTGHRRPDQYSGFSYSVGDSINNGVYRSEDGGDSWIAINNELPISDYSRCTALAINPFNPRNIFASINGKVYSSLDGGDNWEELSYIPSNEIFIFSLAINPTADFLCAGTNDGLWCIGLKQ